MWLDHLFEICDESICLSHVIEKVACSEAGALTVFIGTVREWTAGIRTHCLEYQAYGPMAIKEMKKIGDEVRLKWPGTKIAISHRIGLLQLKEEAVVVAVSSPHRKASFEACEYAIDRLKETVPIWKKEYTEKGSEWIGGTR